MKQYVIVKAYGLNYHVLQYVDNKLETHDILPEYVLDEYVASVVSKGYTRGYYVPEYEKRMLQLKDDYEFALQEFEKQRRIPCHYQRQK